MRQRLMIWVTLIAVAATNLTAEACTLWSANGVTVKGGGSLIVKNRDGVPDHHETIKLVTPDNGYKYIGLFATDGKYPGLKAGVNDHGLVVVSATAGGIPAAERRTMPHTSGLLSKLLRECRSVDEALVRSELFWGPQMLMIADRHKIASIEIGSEGRFAVTEKDGGILYHTNHYLDPSMLEFNHSIGESSRTRYERIGQLLSEPARTYDLDTFIGFSNDRNDGPDNSIFRVGSTPQKTRTVAVWAVSISPAGPDELYVRILNPDEPEQVFRMNIPDVFSGKVMIGG